MNFFVIASLLISVSGGITSGQPELASIVSSLDSNVPGHGCTVYFLQKPGTSEAGSFDQYFKGHAVSHSTFLQKSKCEELWSLIEVATKSASKSVKSCAFQASIGVKINIRGLGKSRYVLISEKCPKIHVSNDNSLDYKTGKFYELSFLQVSQILSIINNTALKN
jgi:hypothetical protein